MRAWSRLISLSNNQIEEKVVVANSNVVNLSYQTWLQC